MSEPVVASGAESMLGKMKPRITLAELPWFQSFARIKALPEGTVLHARGNRYTFHHVLDDPHPPSVWLSFREDRHLQTYICRKGDPLILELV